MTPPTKRELRQMTADELAHLITASVKALEARLAEHDPSVKKALERAMKRLGPMRGGG